MTTTRYIRCQTCHEPVARQSEQTTETSTGYYAAYYRRRAAECRTWKEYAERQGDAESVAFYTIKAHDYDETANALER